MQALRDAGVQVITIGVGRGVDVAQLDRMASKGSDGKPLNYTIRGFGKLKVRLSPQNNNINCT